MIKKIIKKLFKDHNYPKNTCDKCQYWINTRIGDEDDYITNVGEKIGECSKNHSHGIVGKKYYCDKFKKHDKRKTKDILQGRK